MKKTALSLLTLMLAALLMLPVAAHADPIIIPYSATVTPGQTFTVSESIFLDPSVYTSTVFFTFDAFNVDSPITLDDTPFLSSFPLSGNPGDTVFGDVFIISVPSVIAPGLYKGTFSIFGGYNAGATDELSRVELALTVPSAGAVPEPGAWVLLVTGSIALFAMVYTRRRSVALGRVA